MTPDHINALFELCGTFFVLISVRRVYVDKSVAGISWLSPAFFFAWGMWNLYFYPAVGQMWSFYAGVMLAMANATWIAQLLWYGFKQDRISA